MARRKTGTKLPSPYLQNLAVLDDKMAGKSGYPFNLPWLKDGAFELRFTTPVTIIIGENGTGKSTLIEAIAALSGYDEAGGGKGYRPVDHSNAIDKSGAELADVLRAGWLPKVTNGWFFKAESFFSVARYLAVERHLIFSLGATVKGSCAFLRNACQSKASISWTSRKALCPPSASWNCFGY